MAVLLIMPVCLYATTGGPDGGGYTYIDSDEGGGPSYVFEDIADIANLVINSSDDSAKKVSIGFDFMFYGSLYNTVNVSSNGHLDFRAGWGNGSYNFNDLPIPQYSSLVSMPDNGWGVNPLIAPFFDDLDPVTDGEVYAAVKGTKPTREFIVQWDGIPHYDCAKPHSDADNITFQVILYEENDKILFQYRDVTTCLTINNGENATVGLDFDHRVGLQYSSNSTALKNGLAILFDPGTAPAISQSLTSLEFGDVKVGTTTAGLIKLSNPGSALLQIQNTTSPLDPPFSVISDNCTHQSVPTGSFCTLSVLFTPDAQIFFQNSLIINSTDPINPQIEIIVNGTGVGSASPVGDISVTDTDPPDKDLQADFGVSTIYNGSEHVFTIHNEGGTPLYINSIEPPESPFALINDNCTFKTLSAAGGTCDFGVRFVTVTPGFYSSTFNIISEDPDESPLPLFVNAGALYAAVANITVSDSVLPSDDNLVSFDSETSIANVTVGSNGTAALEISSVALVSNALYPGSYTLVSEDCAGSTLTVGQTCTIQLSFTPTQKANGITGTLSIATNDVDESPYTVSLTGNALYLPPSAPVLTYPSNGATGIPTDFRFLWERSTDPDAGDTVTYKLYYTDAADFGGVTPIGPISKAVSSGGIMYASAALGVPGMFLMAAIALGGAVSRRRKVAALLIVLIVTVLMLAACGSGLPNLADLGGYDVTGLKTGTTYIWKVVATDSHGLSAESATWSFTTQ